MAAYVDGTLSPELRLAVEQHLIGCEDCRAIVVESSLLVLETPDATARPVVPATSVTTGVPPLATTTKPRGALSRAMPVLALAAAVALTAWLAPTNLRRWLSGSTDDREMQALIHAVAQEATRPVNGRLSGFAYAPPPSSIRGADSSRPVAPEVRVAAAAIERVASRAGVEGQAALGVAYLVSGDLDAAIEALEMATRQRPDQAAWWNDLSVAYLARGERIRSEVDVARALEASDRSLRLSPESPEAMFNRALALTELGRRDAAASGWTAAERAAAGSPWAAEAATHRGSDPQR